MIYVSRNIIIGILDPTTSLAVHCSAILNLCDSAAVVRLDVKVEHGEFALTSFLNLRDLNGGLAIGRIGDGSEGEEKTEEDEDAHGMIGLSWIGCRFRLH